MTARHSHVVSVAALSVLLGGGIAAAQQSALATLPEQAPEAALYRVGPVLVKPRMTVPEVGHDSNAFNESAAPKEDFVIKLVPEIDFFSDLGVVRVAVHSGSTFTYFHRYDSERSVAEQVRGRVTAQFSRLRPWVGAASVRSNERTTEIDARSERVEREVAVGINFDVSPLATVTVAANRLDMRFADAELFRDTPLAAALDRKTDMLSASLRFQATPLTSLTFRGYASEDQFAFAPSRNSDAQGGEVEVNFGPEAIVRGRLALGFRQQTSSDETVARFRGVTGRGGVTTVLLWRAILGVDYVRDVQYSFDAREGYYVENGWDVVYTQRIGGPFDVQARGGRRALDYSARRNDVSRSEALRTYQLGVGYSLDGGSRFGLSYETAERDGGPRLDRQFSRQRLFGSFSYEFWK